MARFTYIPNRVIDSDGISDGASIYFYAEGTTTPITIYSDEARTTEIANPVVVAAGAAVPAVYFAESAARVRVVDSGGAVVSDDDPWDEPVYRAELASTATGSGASLVGVDAGGTVENRLKYVTPEDFGAIGDGNTANAAVDTAGLQAAVDTGLPVVLRPGGTYIINAEIEPPTGEALSIRGYHSEGASTDKLSTIQAASGFTGYLLKPETRYDIRDLRLIGNNTDGCYLIGNNTNSSTGAARIERVDIRDADIGIYFDGNWEHPFGLYYHQIIGLNFRTGGINLGGVSGAASSGESAWSMDNITLNGNPSGTGIEAPSQSVTANTPSATQDTITWDNSSPPLYGWCVMRSADGSTDWHVPPNWTSAGLNAASFVATKEAAETWNYKVVRMTRGLHMRRSKGVWCGQVQCEYFGVGVYSEDQPGVNISQIYYETRDANPPTPSFAALYANNSNLALGGGWVEQAGYGAISANNAKLVINGPLRATDNYWGVVGIGGSTAQSLMHFANLVAAGTTPDDVVSIAGSTNDYQRAGVEHNTSIGQMTVYADGLAQSGFSVRNRGSEKGYFRNDASGFAFLSTQHLNNTLPSKSGVQVPLANTGFSTTLTAGVATDFLRIDGLTSNQAVSLSFLIHIATRDGGSVIRQSQVCRLDVSIVNVAGTVTAGVGATTAVQAISSGTLGAPVFAAAVSGTQVTISCNQATSQSIVQCFVTPIAGGNDVRNLTVTVL